jgi:hypothetical protein
LFRKKVSVLMLVLLVVGTLALAVKIQPANANSVDSWPLFQHDPSHTGYSSSTGPTTNNILWTSTNGGPVSSSPAVVNGVVYVGSDDGEVYAFGPPPLSVSISPSSVFADVGQPQLFNSSITGGTSPYAYQWYLNHAPASGAISNSWTFTPNSSGSYTVYLNVTDSVGAVAISNNSTVTISYGGAHVCFSVEPRAVPPLLYTNASINGLETPPNPSPIGQYFQVEIHLRNATSSNVPAGVGGVEVHFNFSAILPYAQVINCTDMFGQSGGVLNAPVLESIIGRLYNATGGISNPPYTDAVQYDVAGAELGGGWIGNDGLVAVIYFKITGQPSFSQPDFTAPLNIIFADLADLYANEVPFLIAQGGLHIDAQPLVHDVAVTNCVAMKTVVGQGYGANVSITVANQGNITETFNVTALANGTAISTQQISLNASNQTTLTFTWKPASSPYGNYAISCYAWPVPNETNTANNNCTGNSVIVTIPGDLNGDFKVSLLDLVLLANAYGSKPGDTKWNPNADINGNNIVDLADLVLMAVHYGQHYP